MRKALSTSKIMATVLFLLGAGWLSGSPVGSVQGSVKDASGALVPGVKITLINTSTNAKQETNTNANGEFQFPNLAPSTYSLVAEAQGFKKITSSSVLVQVDQITHLELTLEVGSLAESVQVEAVAPLLENDKSTLSSVVDSREHRGMPLNGRQALDLALITPGVVPTAGGTQVLSFNVAGARSQSNIYLWDGVSNMDTQVNGNLNNFRIATRCRNSRCRPACPPLNSDAAPAARSAWSPRAAPTAITGRCSSICANSDLDATDFFINKAKGTKTPLHRNQFGGTFGGPIKHNKTFFFASYEEFRQVAPTVESDARAYRRGARAGDGSDFKSAAAVLAQSEYDVGANNFIANVGSTTFDYTGLIKIDHDFSDNDHLTGRFADYQGATFTPGALPTEGGNGNTPVSRNGVLTETHTFRPTLLNELRLGYSRNQTFITVQDIGLNAASYFPGERPAAAGRRGWQQEHPGFRTCRRSASAAATRPWAAPPICRRAASPTLRDFRQHVVGRAFRSQQAFVPLRLSHPPRAGPPLSGQRRSGDRSAS